MTTAFKVFRRDVEGNLCGAYYGQDVPRVPGKWLSYYVFREKTRKTRLHTYFTAPSGEQVRYKAGWHAYVEQEAAERWRCEHCPEGVVVPVELRGRVRSAWEMGAAMVVADQMRILLARAA